MISTANAEIIGATHTAAAANTTNFDDIIISSELPPIPEECRVTNPVHEGYVYALAMLLAKLLESILRS